MGVGGQRHAPAALLPVKTRYQFYRRLGGRQGRVRQTLPPPRFDRLTVQTVTGRYTDCTIPAIGSYPNPAQSYMRKMVFLFRFSDFPFPISFLSKLTVPTFFPVLQNKPAIVSHKASRLLPPVKLLQFSNVPSGSCCLPNKGLLFSLHNL